MTQDRPAVGIPIRLPAQHGGATDGPLEVIEALFEGVVEMVERSGARPVRLGPDLEGLDDCAGFVVPGGGDVDPALYDGPAEDPTLSGVSAAQDALDAAVLRFALAHRRPVLGICRGMQLLNVVHGGTLHVDLADSAIVHRFPPAEEFELAVHDVLLIDGTRCAAAYGSRASIPVTSGHHQAVDHIAPGLRAAATAGDGLVEALEAADPAAWAVGVQWHPETGWPDDALRLPLFVALAEAARTVDAGAPA
ncbi:MAG TPA: type 1 glutamine amidotransferase [Amnibacterium sp.]|jgi:putative glutamine amidotransferase|nr:type 1 glutamine amidotransferase [Amnibacterium sp.]